MPEPDPRTDPLFQQLERVRRSLDPRIRAEDLRNPLPRPKRQRLNPQLVGMEGCRVELTERDGRVWRCTIAKSSYGGEHYVALRQAGFPAGTPIDGWHRFERVRRIRAAPPRDTMKP